MFEKRSSTVSPRPRAAGSRLIHIIAIAGAAVGIYIAITSVFCGESIPIVNAQTDMYLSRRIDQIEQRFNYIESRLGQIESQSRMTTVVPRPFPNSNDQDVQFLRAQIDGLRLRLGEVECGLLRVDERTLSTAQRAARRRAAQGSSEKCRENSGSAVELSARP